MLCAKNVYKLSKILNCLTAPSLFTPVLTLANPLMGEQFQKSIKLYPVEAKASSWKDYLEDWIGLENVPSPNTLLHEN